MPETLVIMSVATVAVMAASVFHLAPTTPSSALDLVVAELSVLEQLMSPTGPTTGMEDSHEVSVFVVSAHRSSRDPTEARNIASAVLVAATPLADRKVDHFGKQCANLHRRPCDHNRR